MRRSVICLLLATAAIAAAGCGFGRADDTGRPIPGQYWGWVCPNGDAPDGDAGCPPADGALSDANRAAGDAIVDAGGPTDSAATDR